jgi:hypothetical protein
LRRRDSINKIARKNPHLSHLVSSGWGINGMVGSRLLAFAAVIVSALVVAVFSVRGFAPESARDFEECVEALGAAPSFSRSGPPTSRDGREANCDARFAGRRKPGGGYTYYDFMQGRNFDIAGPNPTVEERNRIDREYIDFLDVQRRQTVAAEMAKRRDEQLRADIERERQAVGPPLVLTPRNTSSLAAKQPTDRLQSTHCEDNSLACGWSKISAVVRNAFASSSKAKP